MRKLVEKNRIIHALDLDKMEYMLKIAKNVEEYVDGIKLSRVSIEKYGLRVIEEVKKVVKLPIIYCCKVADIPFVSAELVEAYINAGADGVTIHGFTGRDTMKECIKVTKSLDAYSFIVVEMSHPGSNDFIGPVGEKIARAAKELGASGIIAPATRASRIKAYREIIGNDLLILSPGVGPQGARPGDAIRAGANFEIIGRLIYTVKDPADAARELCMKIQKTLYEV